MSQPLWDNPRFNKLDKLQDKLFGKVHKFVNKPAKALKLNKKDGLDRDPKQWGEWERRKDRNQQLKEFLKVKSQLKKEFDY